MEEGKNAWEVRRERANRNSAATARKIGIAKKVALLLAENKVTLAEMEEIIKILRYLLEVSLPKSP